jgi:hypothetical protein
MWGTNSQRQRAQADYSNYTAADKKECIIRLEHLIRDEKGRQRSK